MNQHPLAVLSVAVGFILTMGFIFAPFFDKGGVVKTCSDYSGSVVLLCVVGGIFLIGVVIRLTFFK